MIGRFIKQRSGNFALIAAIAAPVVFAGAGGMIDYSIYRSISTNLQAAADSAALAATNQAIIQGWNRDIAHAVASDYVKANMESAGLTSGSYSVQVSVDEQERKVQVNVQQNEFGYLLMGYIKSTPYIDATATAQAISDANVCVIGLMQPQRRAKSAVHLDDQSRIDSPECGIYSDSRDRHGFRVDTGAYVRANVVCSAGGFYFGRSTGGHQIDPGPKFDCPAMGNPLETRPTPTVGACDHVNKVVRADERLYPGVYCGGIDIEGAIRVDLAGGEYIIKDGPLKVSGQTMFVGDDVGFYMTGADSIFEFDTETRVELSAPRTGPLAGLLFFEDPAVPHSFNFNPFDLNNLPAAVRLNRISSNEARVLVGTFYTPKSLLLINANAPVADRSAYTAIVVGRLWLQEGPTLVLNADYAATTVPVPDGIGPMEKGVRLID